VTRYRQDGKGCLFSLQTRGIVSSLGKAPLWNKISLAH